MKVLAKDQIKLKIGEIHQVLVCGDRDRLKQVLVNLISNAIKYTPSGGEVVVTLGKIGPRGRIIVTDNGPGIPEEDIPFIFERFYRVGKNLGCGRRMEKGLGWDCRLQIGSCVDIGECGQFPGGEGDNLLRLVTPVRGGM